MYNRTFSLGIAATCLLTVASCTYLPSSGPSSQRIKSEAASPKFSGQYELVPITGEVVRVLGNYTRRNHGTGNLESFGTPGRQAIAAGDEVDVTIYEASGTLFGAPGGGTGAANGAHALPRQVVDESGEITVPFAGRIAARGRTPHEVEVDIVDKLKQKAVEPQVIVSIPERHGGDLVSVSGDVKTPGQAPVALTGTRILDAVALSGGSIGQPYDTVVSVSRGSTLRSDLLSSIQRNPRKNIQLQPGDTVMVRVTPISFLAFGATGKTNMYPFLTENMSLAEAIASSGGPLDSRANPGTVFLYRHESTRLVRRMGHLTGETNRSTVPVIYQLNLVSPEGFFLARNFQVQDKDIIYYPNAGSVGLLKFLSLLNAVTAPARSGLSTVSGVEAFAE